MVISHRCWSIINPSPINRSLYCIIINRHPLWFWRIIRRFPRDKGLGRWKFISVRSHPWEAFLCCTTPTIVTTHSTWGGLSFREVFYLGTATVITVIAYSIHMCTFNLSIQSLYITQCPSEMCPRQTPFYFIYIPLYSSTIISPLRATRHT